MDKSTSNVTSGNSKALYILMGQHYNKDDSDKKRGKVMGLWRKIIKVVAYRHMGGYNVTNRSVSCFQRL